MVKRYTGKQKENFVSYILDDFSLGEQEIVLKSRKREMDEEYLERLQNNLWNKSAAALKRIIEKVHGKNTAKEISKLNKIA